MASIGEQALKYLESLSKEQLRTLLDEIVDECTTNETAVSKKNMWIMGGVEDRPQELGLELNAQDRVLADKSEVYIDLIKESTALHPEEPSATFRCKSSTSYSYDPRFDDLAIAS